MYTCLHTRQARANNKDTGSTKTTLATTTTTTTTATTKHMRLPPREVCRLFFGGFVVRSLKASSFVWFFRHQDDVSESFSIVVCSCFFGEVAKSVANTVLFVFRFWLNVGVRCEVFVWKASTTRVFLYWWCLKSNVTTRATKNNIGIVIAITVGIVIAFVIFRTSNQYHAKQHQHHQHHQHPPIPPPHQCTEQKEKQYM